MQEQLSIRLKFNETDMNDDDDVLLLMSTIWWIFFSFSFPLVAWYYILLNSIDQQGTPTDAGIEPEKSLPFGAVVHGGHVT